jgi:heme exporter protein CcmB
MTFLTIFTQEFRNFKRNFNNFAQNIVFFIISCAIFLLIAKNNQNLSEIIIFCLVFALIFINSDFLSEDFKDGTIEQMLIFCENFESFIAAKVIINWIFYALPILISSYFLLFLFNFDQILTKKMLILLFFASFSINSICAFSSSLNLLSKKSMLIAIFALPLIIPILLITILGIFEADFYLKSLKILAFCALLFNIIAVFAVSKVIKILS